MIVYFLIMKIKDIKIGFLGNTSPKIIITAEHTADIKYDDIFTTDVENQYFPLIVKNISLTEDVLIPIGYRYMKFDETNSIEELEEIKNWYYRLVTKEEKEKIKRLACLL